MSYSKFKDRQPKDSIEYMKGVLTALGITMEGKPHSEVEGLWSMNLNDKAHGWAVNGKGTTEEYCVASAYGEALERLQNPFYSYPQHLCSKESHSYRGFQRFPDEKIAPVSDLYANLPEIKSDMLDVFRTSDGADPKDDDDLTAYWKQIDYGDETSYLPYYSVRRGEPMFLPDFVISMLCGSNGLSAGNTPREALCQALSEVFERYVKDRLFIDGLTPPRIPEEYLAEYCPELLETIKRIEAKGSFKLIVWDCSLGKGYPVLGCLLVDTARQRYHVKFGSHPQFTIALERCLTEIMQGYVIGNAPDDAAKLTPWTRENQLAWKSLHNQYSMYRSDIGSVPDTLLYATPSWEFAPWTEQEGFTNEKGALRMIDLLLTFAPDVYIRDNSFLGVPAFRVYVPGVSTTYFPRGWKALSVKRRSENVSNIDRFADSLTVKDRAEIIDFLNSDHGDVLNFKDKLPEALVLAALYADNGDVNNAIAQLRTLPRAMLKYHCAARELELARDGVSVENRDYMLELFYGEKAQFYAAMCWRDKNITARIFDPFGYRAMFPRRDSSSQADTVPDAAQDELSALHCRVKDAMIAHPIDQRSVGRMLDEWRGAEHG